MKVNLFADLQKYNTKLNEDGVTNIEHIHDITEQDCINYGKKPCGVLIIIDSNVLLVDQKGRFCFFIRRATPPIVFAFVGLLKKINEG